MGNKQSSSSSFSTKRSSACGGGLCARLHRRRADTEIPVEHIDHRNQEEDEPRWSPVHKKPAAAIVSNDGSGKVAAAGGRTHTIDRRASEFVKEQMQKFRQAV
ncbi:unnamed protein product [Cuscuta campestris]|uniref:Uncharacterized protein n=1 Tax=Cuscuta campestris TaxID=132261 RepID=A0A484KVI1_9ASTE|nr:unnamed protein product [Cuscuta campestris]